MTVLSQCNVVNRKNLFYNKYKFKAKFKLIGARFTYHTKNISEYSERIQYVKSKQWNLGYNLNIINYDNISKFFNFKDLNSESISVRVESDSISIFFNELAKLKEITFNESVISFTEIKLCEPNVILFFKKPKYSYRTFFKHHKTTDTFLDDLNNLIDKIQNKTYDAFISKALIKHLHRGFVRRNRYLYRTYYIDYNEENLSTILHMLFPGSLGKTYKLVQKT